MQRLLFHSLSLVCALGVVAWMLSAAPSETSQPRAPVVETRDEVALDSGFTGEETVIERDRSGQFHLQARVNGEETRFLIDTGADVVALTTADAERIGVNVMSEDFRPIVRTASGTGNGARVQLDRLELGDEEFHDVGAVVVEGLEVNLLGQSVLRRLGKVELQDDRMVIEHR